MQSHADRADAHVPVRCATADRVLVWPWRLAVLPRRVGRSLLPALLLFAVAAVSANPDVDRLLAAGEEPAGVVFEIVEGEEDALEWALPQVRQLAQRLRARFPDLPIAVVTHGAEQFGLLSSEAEGPLDTIHDGARDLRDDGVELHVCGAHAGWYGHSAEDFPDYVDVSPSGPAQINDYVALGFELIRIDEDLP